MLLNHMHSKTVHAPSYFGESCLWVPLERWESEPPPLYMYNARCESLVELVYISRDTVKDIVERFSPWLPQRFESFRETVIKGMQAVHDSGASHRIPRASDGDFLGEQDVSVGPLPQAVWPDTVSAKSVCPPQGVDWALKSLVPEAGPAMSPSMQCLASLQPRIPGRDIHPAPSGPAKPSGGAKPCVQSSQEPSPSPPSSSQSASCHAWSKENHPQAAPQVRGTRAGNTASPSGAGRPRSVKPLASACASLKSSSLHAQSEQASAPTWMSLEAALGTAQGFRQLRQTCATECAPSASTTTSTVSRLLSNRQSAFSGASASGEQRSSLREPLLP